MAHSLSASCVVMSALAGLTSASFMGALKPGDTMHAADAYPDLHVAACNDFAPEELAYVVGGSPEAIKVMVSAKEPTGSYPAAPAPAPVETDITMQCHEMMFPGTTWYTLHGNARNNTASHRPGVILKFSV